MERLVYNSKLKKLIVITILVIFLFQFTMPCIVFAREQAGGTDNEQEQIVGTEIKMDENGNISTDGIGIFMAAFNDQYDLGNIYEKIYDDDTAKEMLEFIYNDNTKNRVSYEIDAEGFYKLYIYYDIQSDQNVAGGFIYRLFDFMGGGDLAGKILADNNNEAEDDAYDFIKLKDSGNVPPRDGEVEEEIEWREMLNDGLQKSIFDYLSQTPPYNGLSYIVIYEIAKNGYYNTETLETDEDGNVLFMEVDLVEIQTYLPGTVDQAVLDNISEVQETDKPTLLRNIIITIILFNKFYSRRNYGDFRKYDDRQSCIRNRTIKGFSLYR